jgi:glyoxylase-like metal-dependent hydrolase (beta-lactamase superfamily II)
MKVWQRGWCITMVVVAALALTTPAGAQAPAAPVMLTVTQLKPTVYEIEGVGSNSLIIIGKTGVIVVDAKTTAEAGRELVADVAKITPKPITTAIITHSDADHVNGLASFPPGVTIIAHENNKKEQEAALAAGGRGAPPADRLPNRIVSGGKETMTIDGVRLELYHYAPAHTSGDLVVYLPDLKVVATGDIIAPQRALGNPAIHPEKNGSTAGWIVNAKAIAKLDADTIMPGHGRLQTKAEVEAQARAAEEKRAKIVALVKQGKTLAEIKEAIPELPLPADAPQPGSVVGGRGAGQLTYTDVVYAELTRK